MGLGTRRSEKDREEVSGQHRRVVCLCVCVRCTVWRREAICGVRAYSCACAYACTCACACTRACARACACASAFANACACVCRGACACTCACACALVFLRIHIHGRRTQSDIDHPTGLPAKRGGVGVGGTKKVSGYNVRGDRDEAATASVGAKGREPLVLDPWLVSGRNWTGVFLCVWASGCLGVWMPGCLGMYV